MGQPTVWRKRASVFVDLVELLEDLAGGRLADDLLQERRVVEDGVAHRARGPRGVVEHLAEHVGHLRLERGVRPPGGLELQQRLG